MKKFNYVFNWHTWKKEEGGQMIIKAVSLTAAKQQFYRKVEQGYYYVDVYAYEGNSDADWVTRYKTRPRAFSV